MYAIDFVWKFHYRSWHCFREIEKEKQLILLRNVPYHPPFHVMPLPPPPPAHHPPSSRLSLFCRPSITPSSILPNIQFVLLHFADEAAAHLLSMFQEEDAIFTDSPDAGSPSVCDDALFVEGI